jgi:hypothetical protein
MFQDFRKHDDWKESHQKAKMEMGTKMKTFSWVAPKLWWYHWSPDKPTMTKAYDAFAMGKLANFIWHDPFFHGNINVANMFQWVIFGS